MTQGQARRNWSKFVPQFDIRWLVGRMHVGTPDSEIAADIARRLAKNPKATEEMIAECVAFALHCHHENGRLYRDVMRGTL